MDFFSAFMLEERLEFFVKDDPTETTWGYTHAEQRADPALTYKSVLGSESSEELWGDRCSVQDEWCLVAG